MAESDCEYGQASSDICTVGEWPPWRIATVPCGSFWVNSQAPQIDEEPQKRTVAAAGHRKGW